VEEHVVGRLRDPAAFRPSASTGDRLTPTRRQAVALVSGLVAVACTVAVASYLVKPNKARSFDLFFGSMFLNDDRAPVAVDLTNGKPTVRLVDANSQVSAKNPSDLVVSPLTNGTLLLNANTGEFNIIDATGFVIKTKGGGVPLPKAVGPTTSLAVPSGESAYILQSAASGSSVFLVGQPTVQSATGADAHVQPRASTTMTEAASTAPGSAVSANGDLWLLVGTGDTHTIRQLSVPRGSDAGATLGTTDHGTVSGAAAIGITPRGSKDVVGVAEADGVQVFDANGGSHTAAVKGLDGVDEILPASNSTGRLRFLYHSSSGWTLVSVDPDSGAADPLPVPDIPADTPLAAPAASGGKLYTMDAGSTGQIWDVAPDGTAQPVAGADRYPVVKNDAGQPLETPNFSDAYLSARGSRVVFNSRNHVDAIALFTDGSRSPTVIDKSAAVSLNAAGDATSLTDQHSTKPPAGQQPGEKPTPQPVQAIDNDLRCRTIKQVPHIPTIIQASPGSRSVRLQWTYSLLDTQDCLPSTYVVSIKVLSAAAPSPPASVRVQGQLGVNVSGLFPSTQYEITVTAFIHGVGTPSEPVQITTGPEGPAAPTNVQASADSSGNWTITWNSCGGIAQGCVPSSTWSVIPTFCDEAGLSAPLVTASLAGDPSRHTFRAVFPGYDEILGRGLTFQVEGIGYEGTVGTPAGDGGCSYSWSHPIASEITLHATQPPPTKLGGTSATTLRLDLGSDPIRAAGGIAAQFSYQLRGTNGKLVAKKGPTMATQVTFDGIEAGTKYTALATVSPPRHPEATVTIGPVPVSTRAAWPKLQVTATFAADPNQVIPIRGKLTVTIGGLASADAEGERFDLTHSALVCGNTSLPLTKNSFDPSKEPIVVDNIFLLQFHGTCQVSITLVENAGTALDPPVFGGTTSPTYVVKTDGSPGTPTLGATAADFTAAWAGPDDSGLSDVVVKYAGAASASDVDALTRGWDIDVVAPDGKVCAISHGTPTAAGLTIPIQQSCLQDHGVAPTGGQWTVTISYRNASGSGGAGPFTEQVSGQPPTYIAPPTCTPTPPATTC
jgi:hypothetical protein